MRGEQTMRQRLTERLFILITRRDVDLLEITFGLLMLGWGAQLLLPWDTFGTAVGYRVLATLMPEWAWGGLLAVVGCVKIVAYLLDRWRLRLGATLVATMLWAFLSVAFGLSNPYGTGIVVYPVLTFVSALIFWRLMTHRMDRG